MEGSFSIHATHGKRDIDTLRALRPDLDPSIELKLLEDFGMEDVNGVVALPGATSLIAALPANAWTIVTSASERLMRRRLQAAGIPLPRCVISAETVIHGKPHPGPYKMGADILSVRPSECMVLEDTPAGIKAGKAAGCSVLAILSSHSAEDLAEADWIVPSLEHVTATPAHDSMIAIHLNA
jgi:sugar-phosphatase